MPTKRTRRTRGKAAQGMEARWLAGALPPTEPPTAETFEDGLDAVFFVPMPNGERHPYEAEWLAWSKRYVEPTRSPGVRLRAVE